MEFFGKKSKSLLCGLLAIVLVLGSVLIAPPTEVEAAAKKAVSFQKNVRVGVGMRYSGSTRIELTQKGYTVNKVKSNSKNLVIKQTYKDATTSSNTYSYATEYSIYAKKAGKYKISFNVVNAKKKKVGKTRTITVHAAGRGSVITGAKIGKTNMLSAASYSSYYTTKKSGKVKFTLAKGCKIKKITAYTRDSKGKTVSKKFRNGRNIKLGNHAYSYGSKYNGSSYSTDYWYKYSYAYTEFQIVYTDSWSLTPKQENWTYFTVYRPATKWYKNN